jgi:hypothetical protein
MALMRVSLVELLRQVAMGRILALEYILLDAREILWLRPVMLGA